MGDVLSDSSVGFARDNGIYRALRLFDRISVKPVKRYVTAVSRASRRERTGSSGHADRRPQVLKTSTKRQSSALLPGGQLCRAATSRQQSLAVALHHPRTLPAPGLQDRR